VRTSAAALRAIRSCGVSVPGAKITAPGDTVIPLWNFTSGPDAANGNPIACTSIASPCVSFSDPAESVGGAAASVPRSSICWTYPPSSPIGSSPHLRNCAAT
jgi:hypothetical protein